MCIDLQIEMVVVEVELVVVGLGKKNKQLGSMLFVSFGEYTEILMG